MDTLRGRKKPTQRVISRPNRLEGECVAINGDGENDSETSSRPRHFFLGTTNHPSVLVVIVGRIVGRVVLRLVQRMQRIRMSPEL